MVKQHLEEASLEMRQAIIKDHEKYLFPYPSWLWQHTQWVAYCDITYVTTSGVAYQLYCGIVPLPIFYNARSGDASIVNCLSSCDLDPDCGAAYLLNEICYYSETPQSYEAADDPETILAIRASSPDPYPDLSSSSSSESSTISSSSSSVEVPPIYADTTT